MALAVLLGGARSGKSALAVQRGLAHPGAVCVIATATAGDAEMAARIEHHRAGRPPSWQTVEEPLDLDSAIRAAPADALLIVDCLTVWLSNQLAADASDDEIEAHSERAAERARAHAAPVIAVSNELGMGIVPGDAVTRRFRDLHGRVNAGWVARAGEALLVVAGATLALNLPPPGAEEAAR
jgi:adenosyl cobinamide kinase/adenosyl cobinamide phosphate guanylyltransferase